MINKQITDTAANTKATMSPNSSDPSSSPEISTSSVATASSGQPSNFSVQRRSHSFGSSGHHGISVDVPQGGGDDNNNNKKQKASSSSSSASRCYHQWPFSKLLTARILFVLCLCFVAAVLGLAGFYFLSASEYELADSQYYSIAERALHYADANILRKRMGAVSVSSMYANQFPYADRDWPNVAIDGFDEMAGNILAATNGRGFAISTIVQPEELPSFEAFAYDYFLNRQRPPFESPEKIGMSSFGRGVYAVSETANSTDKRYHDTTGETSWGSPNTFLTPVIQVAAIPGIKYDNVYMINHHIQESRGVVIDGIKSCSDERLASNEIETSCSALTDTVFLLTDLSKTQPSLLFMEPVYPAFDPFVLKGFVSTSVQWAETLKRAFTEEVSGVDCVIETETQKFTYHITKGVAEFTGIGDLHDPKFNTWAITNKLASEVHFTKESPVYSLTLYPSNAFFQVYSTNNPMIATIGCVLIILFTSLAFLVYDAIVRKEFHDKQAILDAKRHFMRFVSHEVRTPLNSVVMGLKLIQEEVSVLFNRPSSSTSSTNVLPTPDCVSSSEYALQNPCHMAKDEQMNALENVLELSHQIVGSAENAVSILNDLLNYDKIEQGALPLELTIVAIWNIIEKSVNEFKLPFSTQHIHFALDFSQLMKFDREEHGSDNNDVKSMDAQMLPRDVLERRVVGDPIRLIQVLRNLLSNALKFTPKGGKVKVLVSWERRGDEDSAPIDKFTLSGSTEEKVALRRGGALVVSVIDNGAGMTAEQVGRLFRPGVQFNANELQAGKGSGLGLFIAKGICEQHGGSLRAVSEGLGQGTKFTVTLPLYHVPNEALPPSLKRLQLSAPKEKADGLNADDVKAKSSLINKQNDVLRVLVVDDAPMNRKLLTRLLTNRGHCVDQAEDGQQAVDKVKKAQEDGLPYHTVLLDYEMPIMNGPDAAKIMHEQIGSDCFIVGITGNALPEDVMYFKQCGANWVFPKPVKIPDLESVWSEYGITGGSDLA